MRYIVTIEARMGSTRLHRKMTREICGKPALQHVIERLGNSKRADQVVVATSNNPADSEIAAVCETCGCAYFRGSENDVTQRLIDTANFFKADVIVQTWGDCLLQEAAIIDTAIEIFQRSKVDFLSNRLKKSFPAGLEVQVFPRSILERAATMTADPRHREHGTTFIYEHPGLFRLMNFSADFTPCPEKRWLYDYEEDLHFLREVYARLYSEKAHFNVQQVLKLLEECPEVEALNAMHPVDLRSFTYHEDA